MKLTKRFLAMAIAAFMLLTMAPTMSVMAAYNLPAATSPLDLTKYNSSNALSIPYEQKSGETAVIQYSYNAISGSNASGQVDGLVSGFIIRYNSSSDYKGLINSNNNKHFIAGNGYANGAKEFDAVTGEKMYATVIMTRYSEGEGETLEEGTELIYLVNGVQAYSEKVKNSWIRDEGAWNRMELRSGTSILEGSLFSAGTNLDDEAKAALISGYNAALTVNPEYTDVKITGNGVDGKIISNLGVEFIGSLTVADLKQRLVASNESVSVEVYASAEAEEAMAETDIISEGTVVKTVSSNGFTKLTYAVSEGEDPMNMTWNKSGTWSAQDYIAFGRAQNEGETVAIKYSYKALDSQEGGGVLSGLMLSKDGTYNTMQGLLNSNSTKHRLQSNGFATSDGPAREFSAVAGETMYVTVLATRSGEDSTFRYIINGVDAWTATHTNNYLGKEGGWKYLFTWKNVLYENELKAEIVSLGTLSEEEMNAAVESFKASFDLKEGVTDIGIMGNGFYDAKWGNYHMVSALKLNYKNDMTVAQLKNKLEIPAGVTCEVYASAAAETPLEDSVVIPEGAVLKTTSENGFTKVIYDLVKYTDGNITFANDGDGNIVASVNNLFAYDDSKLYIAAYSNVNGSLQLDKVVIGNRVFNTSVINVTLPAADAEEKTIKAFYWSKNLVPIAAATK